MRDSNCGWDLMSPVRVWVCSSIRSASYRQRFALATRLSYIDSREIFSWPKHFGRFIPHRRMNERYIRWWTPHMSRDFEMLVFGDGRGLPLILFPTSFGRHTQNKDFGLTGACAPF